LPCHLDLSGESIPAGEAAVSQLKAAMGRGDGDDTDHSYLEIDLCLFALALQLEHSLKFRALLLNYY
jgi:hypothetical protein